MRYGRRLFNVAQRNLIDKYEVVVVGAMDLKPRIEDIQFVVPDRLVSYHQPALTLNAFISSLICFIASFCRVAYHL